MIIIAMMTINLKQAKLKLWIDKLTCRYRYHSHEMEYAILWPHIMWTNENEEHIPL